MGLDSAGVRWSNTIASYEIDKLWSVVDLSKLSAQHVDFFSIDMF